MYLFIDVYLWFIFICYFSLGQSVFKAFLQTNQAVVLSIGGCKIEIYLAPSITETAFDPHIRCEYFSVKPIMKALVYFIL